MTTRKSPGDMESRVAQARSHTHIDELLKLYYNKASFFSSYLPLSLNAVVCQAERAATAAADDRSTSISI